MTAGLKMKLEIGKTYQNGFSGEVKILQQSAENHEYYVGVIMRDGKETDYYVMYWYDGVFIPAHTHIFMRKPLSERRKFDLNVH